MIGHILKNKQKNKSVCFQESITTNHDDNGHLSSHGCSVKQGVLRNLIKLQASWATTSKWRWKGKTDDVDTT